VKRTAARTAAESGVLVAAAFALSYIEHWIPAAPVPGLKLGLANIVTLIALYRLGTRYAALVAAARCVLAALLFGGLGSLAFSLTGAFFALAAMAALNGRKAVSVYGVSVAGAAAHNLGQTLAASVLMQTPAVFSYLVWLLPLSVPAGLLVALIYRLTARFSPERRGSRH
jgi:heptaprenyl diphosphate synthase